MPRLGLHGLAFTPIWDPTQADRQLPPILEQGVTVIETPLFDPRKYDYEGTRAIAEKFEIDIVCSLGLPDSLDVVARPDDVTEFLTCALLAARDAGAQSVSGITYGNIHRHNGAPVNQDELDAVARVLSRVSKIARQLDLKIGIEPSNRYETHLLNTAKQSVEMIERVGANNIFIHLDTYHMNIEEESMAQGFADAGEHLGYVHLSESNRGVPGRGTLDWMATFKGLKEAGYDGVMTLESFVHLAPEIAPGFAVWRPVADRPEEVISVGLPFIARKAQAAGLNIS